MLGFHKLRGHLCASDCLPPGRIVFSIFNIGIFFNAAVMTQIKVLLFYFSVNFSKSNGIFLCFLVGKGHLVFVAMTQSIQLCITRKMLVIKHVGSCFINVCKSSNMIMFPSHLI